MNEYNKGVMMSIGQMKKPAPSQAPKQQQQQKAPEEGAREGGY